MLNSVHKKVQKKSSFKHFIISLLTVEAKRKKESEQKLNFVFIFLLPEAKRSEQLFLTHENFSFETWVTFVYLILEVVSCSSKKANTHLTNESQIKANHIGVQKRSYMCSTYLQGGQFMQTYFQLQCTAHYHKCTIPIITLLLSLKLPSADTRIHRVVQ